MQVILSPLCRFAPGPSDIMGAAKEHSYATGIIRVYERSSYIDTKTMLLQPTYSDRRRLLGRPANLICK